MADKKEEVKIKKVLVMTELPKQEMRILVDKDGNEYDAMTIDEALTELINNVRDIKKAVA